MIDSPNTEGEEPAFGTQGPHRTQPRTCFPSGLRTSLQDRACKVLGQARNASSEAKPQAGPFDRAFCRDLYGPGWRRPIRMEWAGPWPPGLKLSSPNNKPQELRFLQDSSPNTLHRPEHNSQLPLSPSSHSASAPPTVTGDSEPEGTKKQFQKPASSEGS